jgi:undecaprenyl-diphosphatase
MKLARFLELDVQFSTRARAIDRLGRWRILAVFLAHSGDSWFWLLALALIALLGPAYWQVRAQVLAAGVLITAVIVMVLKFSIRRRRPEGEWGTIYRKSDPHSFPSGHSARGTMLAVLALGLGPVWLGLVLLLWAPLMALARVMLGVHYLSDILAGLILGVLMGFLLLQGYLLFF